MAAGAPRKYSKTYKVPRRPYESARLDAELKLAGEYGLKNKHEIWRVMYTLSKIRRAARELLKLDEKDDKRLFEGNALIRRLVRVGVLDESRMKLDYVLALRTEDFLERRLQTQVFKLGLAKSIHHARVLIAQRHIRYVISKAGSPNKIFQGGQANCEPPRLHGPPRVAEAYRLFTFVSVWRCSAGPHTKKAGQARRAERRGR